MQIPRILDIHHQACMKNASPVITSQNESDSDTSLGHNFVFTVPEHIASYCMQAAISVNIYRNIKIPISIPLSLKSTETHGRDLRGMVVDCGGILQKRVQLCLGLGKQIVKNQQLAYTRIYKRFQMSKNLIPHVKRL